MLKERKHLTGLSGNEIFCLSKVDMRPGQLCVGNSVVAIGLAGGIGAGLSALGGGEVDEVTALVHRGRQKSFDRMLLEARHFGGAGITGISFDLINHGGNLEFITLGSCVYRDSVQKPAQNPIQKPTDELGDKPGDSLTFIPADQRISFSTSADAQQLYCQLDAGFEPLHFVFGNVAYSIGIGGNIFGAFKSLVRGEVSEYSQIFDRTRHLALARITQEAKKHKANAVVGIETTISPLLGAQEMIMVGTASHHPLLEAYNDEPVSSDMTNEEMWNMANLGYLPIRLVMGVSVYSLGIKTGLISILQSIGGGEVDGLTEMLYEAREKALSRIEADAEKCGADEVVGVKIRVYDLGAGLVEFMAIGTAVRKIEGVKTKSAELIPQAIIQDKETFIDTVSGSKLNLGRSSSASARKLQQGPLAIIVTIMVIIFYFFKVFLHSR